MRDKDLENNYVKLLAQFDLRWRLLKIHKAHIEPSFLQSFCQMGDTKKEERGEDEINSAANI